MQWLIGCSQLNPLERYRSRVFYSVILAAYRCISCISTANFQECTASPDRFRCESCLRHFLHIFSKRLQFPLFIGFVRIVIAVFCPSAFKTNWIEYRGSEVETLRLRFFVISREPRTSRSHLSRALPSGSRFEVHVCTARPRSRGKWFTARFFAP